MTPVLPLNTSPSLHCETCEYFSCVPMLTSALNFSLYSSPAPPTKPSPPQIPTLTPGKSSRLPYFRGPIPSSRAQIPHRDPRIQIRGSIYSDALFFCNGHRIQVCSFTSICPRKPQKPQRNSKKRSRRKNNSITNDSEGDS